MNLGALLLVLAAAGPISLPQYAARVHTLRLSLDRLAAQTAPSAAGIGRVQRELRALRRVRLPAGHVVTTGMPLLAAYLTPGTARDVSLQLDALDRGLRALPRSPPRPAELAALDSILRDPRFHPSCTAAECLQEWVIAQLIRFLDGLGFEAGPGIDLRAPIAILFLLILAAAVFLLLRSLRGRMAPFIDARERPTVEVSADARSRSEAAAVAGEYREAMRYLFLAALLQLQEEGVLQFRPGLTNQELVREASTVPSLRRLADRFDAVWYGHQPFGAAEYAAFRVVADEVVRRGAA